jgi:hypothetical protein
VCPLRHRARRRDHIPSGTDEVVDIPQPAAEQVRAPPAENSPSPPRPLRLRLGAPQPGQSANAAGSARSRHGSPEWEPHGPLPSIGGESPGLHALFRATVAAAGAGHTSSAHGPRNRGEAWITVDLGPTHRTLGRRGKLNVSSPWESRFAWAGRPCRPDVAPCRFDASTEPR